MVGAVQAGGLAVTAAALATALATGLGAAPLAFAKRESQTWLGPANWVAAALMLGASGMLFYQGVGSDAAKTLAGAATGIVAIALSARWLSKRESWRFEALSGAQARTAGDHRRGHDGALCRGGCRCGRRVRGRRLDRLLDRVRDCRPQHP